LRRIVGGNILHICVMQVGDKRGHLRIRTLLLPKEEELIIGIEWWLAGQGGNGRVCGVAAGAMTWDAGLGLAPSGLDIRGAF
jgi:hypothetical protein